MDIRVKGSGEVVGSIRAHAVDSGIGLDGGGVGLAMIKLSVANKAEELALEPAPSSEGQETPPTSVVPSGLRLMPYRPSWWPQEWGYEEGQ